MSNLTDLTMTEALSGLDKKEFSAVELTQAHLDAMHNAQNLNAYILDTKDIALTQAADSDKRRADGAQIGKMDGLPVGIKDLFCTNGTRTTACSKILGNFVPPYESTVTQNLFDQGAVMLGKLNMDEFAMGSSNENSAFGNAYNPWQIEKKLTPGGSSGGSAAAVAARIALGATGTDTGGSIRQPASFTGIVGMKPTYGRCSRWGVVAFASSLDQAGAFARNVSDTALMLGCMAGHDPKDTTSAPVSVPDWQATLGTDLKGKTIGIPKEYVVDGMDQDILDLWKQGQKWVEDAGGKVIEISLPHTKYALPAYYIIAPAECSSNLARYDGVRYGTRADGDHLNEVYEQTRAAGFGEEVKRRIMIGTYVLSAGYYDAYYTKAQRVRRLIANDFTNAFENVDAILTPTAPSAAFALGEVQDPITMYLNDVFTVPASLAGLPGISIPGGLNKDGLPLGLQILGKPWDEAACLQVAHALEAQANFTAKP